MPEEQEIIHLPSAGSIPGIPGQHGPGAYVVNWVERTIKRLEDHLAEAEAANKPQQAPATGVPLEGISLPADGVEREFTLEGAPMPEQPPEPPAEPSPNDTLIAPVPEPSQEEAPASEEAQPAAPQEASEEVQPAAEDAAQE